MWALTVRAAWAGLPLVDVMAILPPVVPGASRDATNAGSCLLSE